MISEIKNLIIVHYGCSNFKEIDHRIFWLGAVYYLNHEKTYFFEYGPEEAENILKFKTLLNNCPEKTIVHWSMNTPKFGFSKLVERYRQLTGNTIKFNLAKCLDLSEFLKNHYGEYYVARENGRLDNLARLNNFSGLKTDIEVADLYKGSDRLELIFSIVNTHLKGELLVEKSFERNQNTANKELHNEIFKYNAFEVFETYKENKSITFQSRTDLRVIYDLLKNDGLLQERVELKHYIDWLNMLYFEGNLGRELKKQNLQSQSNIKREKDYKSYKKTKLQKIDIRS